MRNSLMSLLAERGKAGRFDMIVGEYGSYWAYNLTLDSTRTFTCHLERQRQRLKDAAALTAQHHDKNGQVRATSLRGHDVAP